MGSIVLPSLRRIISGDLSLFGGPAMDKEMASFLRGEQISIIRRYLPWMMLANAFNATVLVAALWASPERPLALGWASVIIGFAAIHGRRRGERVTYKFIPERTIRRAVANALLLGSLWAALPVLFFNDVGSGGQLVIACLCAGMLGGGAIAFATIPAAAIAFTAPIIVGSGIAIAQNNDLAYWLVALLMVAYSCVLLRGVFLHAFGLINRLVLQHKAEAQARTDPLTKLPNRVCFEQELERALARLARYGEGFAVLYLDVDNLKPVNDRMGHAAGDELLVEIASRLRTAARATDLIARLGGDEFAMIAVNISGQRDALAAARRITEVMESSFAIDGQAFFTGVSIGIAIAPVDRDRCGDARQRGGSSAVSRKAPRPRIRMLRELC
jgi:diguanylate cyclase (GGDEF)-like protein